MAIVKTIDGSYYEVPDEILQKYRVPDEVVAKHACRVRDSVRIDVQKDFGADLADGQDMATGEKPSEDPRKHSE